VRVTILQFPVVTGSVEGNLGRVEELVARAMTVKTPPDVLVLPELWSTGYALRRMPELATRDGEREAVFLGGLARRYHVAFVGGSVMAAAADGSYANRAQIIDREGRLIGWYDKAHLFSLMEEDTYFRRGERGVVCRLEGVPCGVAVCYDIRFGEFLTSLALEGAQVLFISAAWPKARIEHWTLLARARAVELQLFVVACNRCGSTRQTEFGGHSIIVAPEGQILAEAGEDESILSAELDLTAVGRFRAQLPALADRRPELYGKS